VSIRDETQNVGRKARARAEREQMKKRRRGIDDISEKVSDESRTIASIAEPRPALLNPCLKTLFDVAHSSMLPIYRTVPVSAEYEAFCFVFSQYIIAESILPDGSLDFSKTRTCKYVSLNETYNNAITSVGMAALSNASNNRRLMVNARTKLASVLQQTMEALRDPVEARSDMTLRTVMMLWLFQVGWLK
jgi:hypothetical protein